MPRKKERERWWKEGRGREGGRTEEGRKLITESLQGQSKRKHYLPPLQQTTILKNFFTGRGISCIMCAHPHLCILVCTHTK